MYINFNVYYLLLITFKSYPNKEKLHLICRKNPRRTVSETYMPPWCKMQNYYLYVQGTGATPAPS